MVKNYFKYFLLSVVVMMTSCKIDIPKEVQTSYETITVEKQDITVPVKFSAKLKGQSDKVRCSLLTQGKLVANYIEVLSIRKNDC